MPAKVQTKALIRYSSCQYIQYTQVMYIFAFNTLTKSRKLSKKFLNLVGQVWTARLKTQ